MNGGEYGLHEAMRAEGIRVVAGPGPLREVLPEALDKLAARHNAVMFLLWSNKHGMWWAPEACGYTGDVARAGRYTEAEAVKRVAQSALCGRLDQVTCMVAAPENWTAAES